VNVGTVGVNLALSTSRVAKFCVDRRYFADSPKLQQLLPSLGRDVTARSRQYRTSLLRHHQQLAGIVLMAICAHTLVRTSLDLDNIVSPSPFRVAFSPARAVIHRCSDLDFTESVSRQAAIFRRAFTAQTFRPEAFRLALTSKARWP
jgi:hypothetical protein